MSDDKNLENKFYDDDEEHNVIRTIDEEFDSKTQELNLNNENSFSSPNNSDNSDNLESTENNLEKPSVENSSDRENSEAEKQELDNIEENNLKNNKEEQKNEHEEKFIPPSQALKNEKKEPESSKMGLLDHLSELRKRLTRIVIIILLGFFGCYGISEIAYAYLALPLTELLPENSTLIYTSPQGAFFTYLKVSFMLSVIVTCPLTFYQIWAFIAPGLYEEEQKALMPLAFFSALFFVGGAAFCYFLVFPIAFKFFLGFTTATIVPMISVEEYLSFSLKLLIAFGLVFEMPLFSYFLAKMRLIGPDGMRKYRKYAILIIFIVAAILTPPDVFSQVLMAMPMFILYESSIYIVKIVRQGADKKFKEKNPENNEDNQENEEKINNFK